MMDLSQNEILILEIFASNEIIAQDDLRDNKLVGLKYYSAKSAYMSYVRTLANKGLIKMVERENSALNKFAKYQITKEGTDALSEYKKLNTIKKSVFI